MTVTRLRRTSLPAGRILGVAGGTLLATISQVVVLSAIAYNEPSSAWAAIAVGQSIGNVTAIAGAYGWNLSGPARWALSPAGSRDSLYFDSLRSRLLACAVVLPVALAVGWAIAPQGETILLLTTVLATTSVALSPNWFNVAESNTGAMLGYNFVPRSAAALGAAALVLVGLPAITFPVLLLSLTALATVLFTVRARRRGPVTLAPLVGVMRAQSQAALTDFTGGSFAAANLTLVATQVSLTELAQYTSAQRVYQLGIIALLVLSQSLQGWTVDPHGNRAQRSRTALKAHVLLGLGGGLLLAVVGPPLSAILFGDPLAAPAGVTVMLAASFALLSCSTGAGLHVLIPHGHQPTVLRATVTASLLGVVSVLAFAHVWGQTGGAAGLALSQLVALLILVPMTHKVLSGRA